MRPEKKKLNKGNYIGGVSFVATPRQVLRSKEYATLSPLAVKLLFDLAAQHNGKNNGDLCCTFSMMKLRGWNSSGSLHKAKQELLQKQFIQLTRQGGRNKPNLYAITFFRIDECKGKIETPDTLYPSNDWISKDH